jgi:UDP-glucose 4-epimerase
MKALVTGGAGFIGSHLVDRLIADGHDVTVLDDLSTGRQEYLNPRARNVTGDISRLQFWGYPRMWDWVFHLAGRADVVPSIENPNRYFRDNVLLTEGLLEHLRWGASLPGGRFPTTFVYAASSSCYGTHPPVPTREDAPIAPAHPYALTKRLGEELVLHYGQVYGLPVVSLRLFNVYGPRARTSGAYGAVIGTFLAQKANGAPLTIVGDGTQMRDFVWIEDVVEAFILAAQSKVTGVFNIGNGAPVGVGYLAHLIGGPTVHVPARGGEPQTTWADVTQAGTGLQWKPRTGIHGGMEQLLKDLTPWKTAPVWTPDAIAKATESWHRHLS